VAHLQTTCASHQSRNHSLIFATFYFLYFLCRYVERWQAHCARSCHRRRSKNLASPPTQRNQKLSRQIHRCLEAQRSQVEKAPRRRRRRADQTSGHHCETRLCKKIISIKCRFHFVDCFDFEKELRRRVRERSVCVLRVCVRLKTSLSRHLLCVVIYKNVVDVLNHRSKPHFIVQQARSSLLGRNVWIGRFVESLEQADCFVTIQTLNAFIASVTQSPARIESCVSA
jgi:hypothetical protein